MRLITRVSQPAHLPEKATVLSLILLLLLVSCPVQAAFVGNYDLSNFILLNSNADGTATSPDGGLTLVVTGGNNGTGFPGTTYFLMFAPEPALVSFRYLHTTLDDPINYPGVDLAGYLLGGKFWSLPLNTVPGLVSFVVAPGEGFGFGVQTLDNFGGPAILTVTDFSAQSVPEPATAGLITAAGGYMLWRHRRRGSARSGSRA